MTLFNKAADDKSSVDYTVKALERFKKEDGSLDAEALAKSWAHAQEHVARVEAEAAEVRSEMQKRLSFEELAAKIDAAREQVGQESNDTDERNDSPTKNDVDIEALVEAKVNQLQQKSIQQRNLATVQDKLIQAWGPGYVETLKERAKELEVSHDYLNNLAATSPKAFEKMVIGEAAQPPPAPSQRANPGEYVPPRSSVRGSAPNASNVKNWAYYEKIRKTDRRTYDSPKLQYEMFQQASAMGPDFYK